MSIVILNTGCANLASVQYAVQRLGYQVKITDDPDTILTASKVLLPGVGTASAAMAQLQQKHLINVIKACTQPVLGICLGMQILANDSEEGHIKTLALVDSSVKRMKSQVLPLPHMGWNQVLAKAGNPLFKAIPDNSYFYFVHGFAMPLSSATIAEAEYGDKFTAALQQDNFFGVQFHPERSGKAGAQLLKNFLEM